MNYTIEPLENRTRAMDYPAVTGWKRTTVILLALVVLSVVAFNLGG